MPDTSGHKPSILLIEDEEILANLLVSKLEKTGFAVRLAKDGEAGLAAIRSEKPDLILLDMMLPKLDGFGVLEALKAENLLPALPVIVISNSGQPIEIERARTLGIRDYLIKVNFDPNEVVAMVERVLNPDATRGARMSAPADPAAAAGNTILVVEDDVFLAELIERKLAQKNYAVLRAPDVAQARRLTKESRPRLILLDLVLPGVHGWTFLEELKADADLKDIPVVIISNLGQEEELQRGMQAGAAAYIVKANATPDEILEKVETILKGTAITAL